MPRAGAGGRGTGAECGPWWWTAPSCPQQNIETWMKDKSEVEVVDLVLKLREKLVRCLLALSSLHQPDVEATCP